MNAGLAGMFFGGETERVVSHRVQHVVAGHALVAGVDIGADESQRVTNMETGTGRVREHVHDEQLRTFGEVARAVGWTLGQRPCGVGRVVRASILPALLPCGFDRVGEGSVVAVLWSSGGGGLRIRHGAKSTDCGRP